jgi:hypothetical protein
MNRLLLFQLRWLGKGNWDLAEQNKRQLHEEKQDNTTIGFNTTAQNVAEDGNVPGGVFQHASQTHVVLVVGGVVISRR